MNEPPVENAAVPRVETCIADFPGRAAIVALAGAGVFHVAAIARAGAESGECVVAYLAWVLGVMALRGSAGARPALPRVAGLLALLFTLVQSARMADTDLWFLKLLPFLLGGGAVLALLGMKDAIRNWRLWLALAIAVAPNSILAPILDPGHRLTAAHAPAAGFLLHYLGFDAHMKGLLLRMPAGNVRVEGPCSGFALMVLLLKVALLVCVMLPMRRRTQLALCVAGLSVGLAVGVIRVAILAAVLDCPAWFQWLHGPAGRNLFPLPAFLCFALFLFPAEEPLAMLLRRFHAGWTSANSGKPWSLPVRPWTRTGVLLLVFACGLACFADHAPDCLPQPVSELALCGSPAPLRMATLPPNLNRGRFDRIESAWLWTGTDDRARWTVLISQVSGGREGPFELLQTPRFREFIRAAIPSLPARWTMPISNGHLGFFAMNDSGRVFLDTGGYLNAQTAALKEWRTWAQWLCTGRRLQDRRYWFAVIVATETPRCDP